MFSGSEEDIMFKSTYARILRIGLAAVVAIVLGVAGVLATTTAASAHEGQVTGTPSCAPSGNGLQEVAWTVTTTNVPSGDVGLVTATGFTPSGSTLSGLPQTIGPNKGMSFTQTEIPATAVVATVSLLFEWTPAYPGAPESATSQATAEGQTVLTANCQTPTTTTTTTTVPPVITQPTTTPTTTVPPVITQPTTTPTTTVPPVITQPTTTPTTTVPPVITQAASAPPTASAAAQPVIQTGGRPPNNTVADLVVGVLSLLALVSALILWRRRRYGTN
jgi:hypothetical protein